MALSDRTAVLATSETGSGGRGRPTFWWVLSCLLSGLAALALSGTGLADAAPVQIDAAGADGNLTVAPDFEREKRADVNVPQPCNAYSGHCINVPNPAPAPTAPAPAAPAPPAPIVAIDCTVRDVTAVFVETSGNGYQLSYGGGGCLASALDVASGASVIDSYVNVATGSVQFFHGFNRAEAESLIGTSFTGRFEGETAAGQSVLITISGTITGFSQ